MTRFFCYLARITLDLETARPVPTGAGTLPPTLSIELPSSTTSATSALSSVKAAFVRIRTSAGRTHLTFAVSSTSLVGVLVLLVEFFKSRQL